MNTLKKIQLILFGILATLSLQAQPSWSIEQKEAQQTMEHFFNALSNRDSISLKNYSIADISLYEYGQVWNIDTLILKAITLNQSADFKRTNSFEFLQTTVDKTTAWVTYRLQSAIFKDGKQTTLQWLETVALVREKKQWKVKHLHSTLINRS